MNQAYKAPNGEIIVAQDEVQAAAFENAGLEPVDEQPTRRGRPKNEE